MSMFSSNINILGNGIVEISGPTDSTRALRGADFPTTFIKRGSIASIEHKVLHQEIRVDIVGKSAPIVLMYMGAPHGNALIRDLQYCMKDASGDIEDELQGMRKKEEEMRVKIETLKVQMEELRVLLQKLMENIAAAGERCVPATAAVLDGQLEDEKEELESVVGPTDLEEYEPLSEIEDQKVSEFLCLSDATILFIMLSLICIFLISLYINLSKYNKNLY